MNILDSIEAKLNNIENLLLDIKHNKSSAELKKEVPRKQAAKVLHCSERTLDEMTRNGELEGFRIGSRIYYNSDDLEAAFKKIRTFS